MSQSKDTETLSAAPEAGVSGVVSAERKLIWLERQMLEQPREKLSKTQPPPVPHGGRTLLKARCHSETCPKFPENVGQERVAVTPMPVTPLGWLQRLGVLGWDMLEPVT